jgi:NarL family two-component system response regulator LiaR
MRYTILVLEDENEIGRLYHTYSQQYFDVVYRAQTCAQALEIASIETIHAVIADHNLPDGPGTEALHLIKQKHPLVESAVITGYANKDCAMLAANIGVCSFLEKPVTRADLISVIAKMRKNAEIRIKETEFLRSYSISDSTRTVLMGEYGISMREAEIIDYGLQPHEAQDIGDMLNISKGTVRRHFENIFHKLSIGSRRELRQFVKQLNESKPAQAQQQPNLTSA